MRYPVYSALAQDGHSVLLLRKSISYCERQCEPQGDEAPYAEWIDVTDKKRGIRLLSVDDRKAWSQRKEDESLPSKESSPYITMAESSRNAVGQSDKKLRTLTISELMAMKKVSAYPTCFDTKAVRVPGVAPAEFERIVRLEQAKARHANN